MILRDKREKIMCEWGNEEEILVKIPYDLSHDGRTTWKRKKIDTCIASLVRALQVGGINMRGSCCGHNRSVGNIHLQDGRVLVIMNFLEFDKNRDKINEILGKR